MSENLKPDFLNMDLINLEQFSWNIVGWEEQTYEKFTPGFYLSCSYWTV
jgi:hypothetical protein